MATKTISQDDLGFLGEEYQSLLVKALIEDQDFFVELYPILDQNMFTSPNLKRVVGFMKDYYGTKEVPPTYKTINLDIRTKVSNAVDLNSLLAMMNDMYNLKDTSAIELVKERSSDFFKQQNLIKAVNKIQDLIKKGQTGRYAEAEEIIQEALEQNCKQEFGFRLFDNVEADLQEDYRKTIPTGARDLDKGLSGGLGRGELGVIIASMGVGKTSATTGFAAYAATTCCEANNWKGYKVLHFFFEDEEVNIRRKYYGFVTDIDACDLSRPDIKPKAIEILNNRVCESVDEFGEVVQNKTYRELLRENIYCERLSSGEVTASEIKQKIKKYIAAGFNPDLVIIDYFECIKPESGADLLNSSEWSKEGITMRKLESTAKELNVGIWVPIQGSKDAIGMEFLGLQHAGGSVKKTQIGHVIIGFAQTPDQKPRGLMNITINKLRAARIKDCVFENVAFNNGTGKFNFDYAGEEFMPTSEPVDPRGIPMQSSNQLQNIANHVRQRNL